MYLHIFGSKACGFKLYYTSTPELSSEVKVERYPSRQAAKLAALEAMKACSALIPWNFTR